MRKESTKEKQVLDLTRKANTNANATSSSCLMQIRGSLGGVCAVSRQLILGE